LVGHQVRLPELLVKGEHLVLIRVRRRSPLTLLGAVLILSIAWALTQATAHAGAIVPGWRSGEAIDQSIGTTPADASASTARATGYLKALGIIANRASTSRALDRTTGRTLDTTVALGKNERPVATVKFDVGRGKIQSVVRFAWQDGPIVARGDAVSAEAKGRGFLKKLGLDTDAKAAVVSWDDGMQSWLVTWPRTIGGFAAPGNSTSVWVDASGDFRAASSIETATDAAPANPIAPADALARAKGFLSGNPISARARLGQPTLEWRQPNNFLDPAQPDAIRAPMRLVYAVPYEIPVDGQRTGKGELWLDAADNHLVGGAAIN
jgi:hypothetical protein